MGEVAGENGTGLNWEEATARGIWRGEEAGREREEERREEEERGRAEEKKAAADEDDTEEAEEVGEREEEEEEEEEEVDGEMDAEMDDVSPEEKMRMTWSADVRLRFRHTFSSNSEAVISGKERERQKVEWVKP
jgi:hypothetical protein